MRERVGAIIIENDKLLTEKREKDNETYWVFPGGGVDEGEDHAQALERECQEELGVIIKSEKLLYQCFFKSKQYPKQKEFFYKCKIIGGELGTGNGPEWQENSICEGTREIQWLEIKELNNFDLRPKEIKKIILE